MQMVDQVPCQKCSQSLMLRCLCSHSAEIIEPIASLSAAFLSSQGWWHAAYGLVWSHADERCCPKTFFQLSLTMRAGCFRHSEWAQRLPPRPPPASGEPRTAPTPEGCFG